MAREVGAKSDTVLSVRDLSAKFSSLHGSDLALDHVGLDLARGEMLGIAGETGAGKTVLVQSIMNQVRFPGQIVSGRVLLNGEDLLECSRRRLRQIRGSHIAIIGSSPRGSLDPLARIGHQLGRALLAHTNGTHHETKSRVIESLTTVGIPDPERRYYAYPHELSVGMAQRVICAMALLHSPDVILADEPTAGLDVTVQRQVLNLMKDLLDRAASASILVTRDLGIIAKYCDRVGIMRDGRLIEDTAVRTFFTSPRHPYSRALLQKVTIGGRHHTGWPRERTPFSSDAVNATTLAQTEQGLLSVENLVKHFPLARSRLTVKAVNDVSFALRPAEAIGLVGESGSGKTTVARLILGLIRPTSGRVLFEGHDLTAMGDAAVRRLRSRIQMVFQEPNESLNPYMTSGRNIEEPLILQRQLTKRERRERVRDLLQMVQLEAALCDEFPHTLSAGQAQRVGIARAIATNPSLIVLDEPTSQLDIGVRADILELLVRIREELRIAFILISHDLTAVRSVCSRIGVMYLGRIVEEAATESLFREQRHPYTKALLAAVFDPDPEARSPEFSLSGEIPSPIHLPAACHLYSRCPLATDECNQVSPALVPIGPDRLVACHHHELLAGETGDPGRL